MGLPLLANCSSQAIHIAEDIPDSQWCHPFTNSQGQEIGASCDRFMTSDPELLDQAQWLSLQASWGVTECTNSSMMIAMKVFIEKTCSQVTCDEATKQAFLDRCDKISHLGE